MALDRHRVWREVAHVFEQLEKHPRDGFRPVVEAFTVGSDAPVVVAVAETRRDPDYPWVKLYTGDEKGGYVFVHEDHVTRVDVTYKSTEVPSVVSSAAASPSFPPGFRATIAGDDDTSGAG